MDFKPNFIEIVSKVNDANKNNENDVVKATAGLSTVMAAQVLEQYHYQLWAELKRRKIVE